MTKMSSKVMKFAALAALTMSCASLFAYNGGYENSLLTDTVIGGITYKGYGNNTVTKRTESGATIAANTYAQCKKLKSVNLTGVTSIGDAAFAYSALESLTLPATVKSLGYIAFGGCTNLTSATFGSTGWYSASKEPFNGCVKLETITVSGGVPTWGAGFVALFPNLKNIRCPKANIAAWQGLCPSLKVMDKDAVYKIVYHKYDGSDVAVTNTYPHGVNSSLLALPTTWARKGMTLKGWATTPGKADAGTIWKAAGALVSAPVAAGGTLHVYATWNLNAGWYCLRYNKNDGSGAWRTVAYQYGVETTLPSVGAGLGWSRKGYEFFGWSTSVAKAAAYDIWRGDKGITKTPTKAGTTLNVYASWKRATTYQIEFNKNDGSGATYVEKFTYGKETALPSYANAQKMGWGKRGFDFKGWASSVANAKAGKVWKADKAKVSAAAEVGATLKVYAVYKVKSDSYGLQFHKNDGTSTYALVGYQYGVKTRLPTCAGGLGWSRTGYTFKGWALGKANADAGKVWKQDWAYVSTGVPAGTIADVYAVWTKKSANVASVAPLTAEEDSEVAPFGGGSTSANEEIPLPTVGYFHGMTADGTGCYDLLADASGAFVYVTYEDGRSFSAEGEALVGKYQIVFVSEEGGELMLLRRGSLERP